MHNAPPVPPPPASQGAPAPINPFADPSATAASSAQPFGDPGELTHTYLPFDLLLKIHGFLFL